MAASRAAKARLEILRENDPRLNPQPGDRLISRHGTEVHVIWRDNRGVKFRYADDEIGGPLRRVKIESWVEHFKDAAYIVR